MEALKCACWSENKWVNHILQSSSHLWSVLWWLCNVCVISSGRKGIVWKFQAIELPYWMCTPNKSIEDSLHYCHFRVAIRVLLHCCCFQLSREDFRPARCIELVALTDRSLGEILVTLSQEILAAKPRGMGLTKKKRIESSSRNSRVWNESWF